MSDTKRIELIRLPSMRDLEYISRRYLRVGNCYDIPLGIANALLELGHVTISDGDGEVVNDYTDLRFKGKPKPS